MRLSEVDNLRTTAYSIKKPESIMIPAIYWYRREDLNFHASRH